MNSEEDEFRRIEAEALRLWAAQTDDDDTQGYVSENFLADYRAGAEAEREACVSVCETIARKYQQQHHPSAETIADECAAAIRARGTDD